MAEPLHRHERLVVVRIEHVLAFGHVAGQQPAHRVFAHAAALFQDDVVLASFDFEEDRRVRLVVVVAQAELESIPVPVNSAPVRLQTVRVEIEAQRGIRPVRLQRAVFVNFQVAPHEIPNAKRLRLVDVIFQFVALML